MDTQKFFSAITKLNISQNRLAESFNTSASTVNAWIKQNRQPQLTARDIYNAIDECRSKYSHYKKQDDFINDFIKRLDITETERNFFTQKFDNLKSQDLPEDICYEKFMLDVIQMSLDRADCPCDLITYDPASTSRPVIGIGIEHIVAVREDGRVYSAGANDYQQCTTYTWRDIVSISSGWRSTVGLKRDGTCIAIGNNVIGNGEIYKWTDIISIACGAWHTLGLRSNGSVVAFGQGGYGQCHLEGWSKIKAIAAGDTHSVGLKNDGTVIAAGNNEYGQCNVLSWKDIICIAAGGDHTFGLTADGKILAAGDINTFDFRNWTDIISLATGKYHLVALKKDGTVLATGHNASQQCDVYRWHDIIAVYAGYFKTAAITSDGRVVSTVGRHEKSSAYTDTSSWQIFKPLVNTDNKLSKFESVRLQALETMNRIKQLQLQYMPFINEYRSPTDIHYFDHTSDIDQIIRQLHQLSKKLYNDVHLPPITDLLLEYHAAFVDFYNSLVKEKSDPNDDIFSYTPSPASYEAFVTLVMITNKAIKNLQSL